MKNLFVWREMNPNPFKEDIPKLQDLNDGIKRDAPEYFKENRMKTPKDERAPEIIPSSYVQKETD